MRLTVLFTTSFPLTVIYCVNGPYMTVHDRAFRALSPVDRMTQVFSIISTVALEMLIPKYQSCRQSSENLGHFRRSSETRLVNSELLLPSPLKSTASRYSTGMSDPTSMYYPGRRFLSPRSLSSVLLFFVHHSLA